MKYLCCVSGSVGDRDRDRFPQRSIFTPIVRIEDWENSASISIFHRDRQDRDLDLDLRFFPPRSNNASALHLKTVVPSPSGTRESGALCSSHSLPHRRPHRPQANGIIWKWKMEYNSDLYTRTAFYRCYCCSLPLLLCCGG